MNGLKNAIKKIAYRKILVMLIIASLMFATSSWTNFSGIFAAVATYGKTDDGQWAYKILNETTRHVAIRPSDLGATRYEDLTIPASVEIQGEAYTVEEIGTYAFSYCVCSDCLQANRTNLSVAWDDNDGNYESKENKEIKIKKVTIPTSVKTIGYGAFQDCHLDDVVFQQGARLSRIEDEAFMGTIMKDITIPATVNYIGEYAFSCSELEYIYFEEGIQIDEILPYTFESSYLKEIDIPDSVTSIREGAFYFTELEKIDIPAPIDNIGNYAFEACINLKEVNLKEDGALKNIRKGAFMACNLKEVTIPSTVVNIGLCAFGNNKNLQTVIFNTTSKINTVNKNAFAKVVGYDVNSNALYEDDFTYSKNTSITQVNVENYDVYNWLSGLNILQNNTKVYSKNTRVFVDSENNSKDDVSMNQENNKTISIEDYESIDEGYHFEDCSFEYVDSLAKENKNQEIEEFTLVSLGYPFVILKINKKINEYEIEYITNTDQTFISNTLCKYNQEVILDATTPIKTGYRFIGWCENENGEGDIYQPAQVINKNFTTKHNKTIRLYGIWEEITKKVTVSFSTPKNIQAYLGFEIVVARDGQTIQQHDIEASDIEGNKITIYGARVGERYTITCTNYKKENGKKTYYTPSVKEVVIE